MAAIKISDLPSVETPALTDILPTVNNGETKKITLEQIVNLAGGGSGGTSNYEDLTNKPKINGVELTGDKSLTDLGINIPTSLSELTNDTNFVNQTYVDTAINTALGTIETTLQAINSGSGV